jgi:hypothetical protein
VALITDSLKVDIIRVLDSMILHQQIEKRDGRTYMRMKRRNSLIIK